TTHSNDKRFAYQVVTEPPRIRAKKMASTETDLAVRETPVNEAGRELISTGYALLAACRCGKLKAVQDLLVRGADINVQDPRGKSALVYAAMTGHTEVVSLLVEHGANLEVTSADGKTPLAFAVSRGNTNVVDILLKAGANIGFQLPSGDTVLHIACEHGYLAITELLL
ncbi:hypothetical protein PPTG_23671, partial [Phytophthora nicotianae INRA-310]